ncbi:MAG: alanyl-tRNA editing protein AlaXM [Candidatus Micrarchaeota archaeon]|nr:alanyl-tRNA editing protein AlaXM [Candidatus Micrarchaeota archaeon]
MQQQSALYLLDSYLRSCEAEVISVKEGRQVALDRTVFYPRGGGQPSDTGKLVRKSDGREFSVVSVSKAGGEILHEVSQEGLQPKDKVEAEIDWERRYRLMRMHTAGHILSAIMYKSAGILITGNQIDIDKTRFDFSMENFDREAFQKLIDEANAQIARNLEVSISFLPREEALKVEGAVKLAAALPPEIKELRMVKIGDIDWQADGGTHVRNTSEIGRIVFLGAENKGKSNRRIYYKVEP